MEKTNTVSEEKRILIEKRLLAAAKENRVLCSGALALAKSLDVPSEEIGRIANDLNIKISKCQLGCF